MLWNWRHVAFVSLMVMGGLASLNFGRPPSLFLWKLSILTKEFGNWAFILFLPLGVWFFLRTCEWQSAPTQRIAMSVCGFGLWLFFSAVFLWPIVQAFQLTESVQVQLKETFAQEAPELISFAKLWGLSSRGGSAVCATYQRIQIPNQDGQAPLHFDLYSSDSTKKQKRPWLMVVHGGGWDSGDTTQLSALNTHLCNKLGVNVVAVSYGLAPMNKWPQQQKDLSAQLNYLLAHADELGLDADQWAILGRSAGGQLAGNFAYSQMPKGLKAALLFYPATDLIFGYEAGDEDDVLASRSLLRRFMGRAPLEDEAFYRSASVIDFISPDVVPTVLFHGVPDTLTWVKHSERLFARLKRQKSKTVFVRYPWAAHGFDFRLSGPAGQISTNVIETVLQRVFAFPTGVAPESTATANENAH